MVHGRLYCLIRLALLCFLFAAFNGQADQEGEKRNDVVNSAPTLLPAPCTGPDCPAETLASPAADRVQAPGGPVPQSGAEGTVGESDAVTTPQQLAAQEGGREKSGRPLAAPVEESKPAAAEQTLPEAVGLQLSGESEAAGGAGAGAEQATLTQPSPQLEQPAPPPIPEPPREAEPLPEMELRNFANVKDGAKVVQANKEAKKLSALLDSDSDTYVKNDCKADKWYIIELSQVAKIMRVELWQHELYSSRVKNFEVRGRQSHPRVDGVELSKGLNSSHWRLLGGLTAENKKGSQVFALEHPMWVRYLLLQLQSHYGSEPMCAINGFAAYGKSAAEEFEDHLAAEEALQYLQNTLEQQPLIPPTPEPAVPMPSPAPAAAQQPPAPAAEPKPDRPEAGKPPAAPIPAGGGLARGSIEGGRAGAGHAGEAAPQPVAAAAAPGRDSQPSCSGEGPSCGTEQKPVAAGAQGPGAEPPPQQQPAAPAALTTATADEAGEQQPGNRGRKGGSAAAEGKEGNAEEGSAVPGESGPTSSQEAGPAGDAGTATAQHEEEGGKPADAQQRASDSTAAAAPEQDASGATSQQQQTAAAGSAPAAGPGPQAQPSGAPLGAPGQQPVGAGQLAAGAAGAAQGQQQASVGDGGEDLASILAWAPKSKASASVYDVLLQEIRAAKVQQKVAAKAVADLQRNLTAQHGGLAAEVARLADQLAKAQREASESEQALAVRVEALVDARLQQLSQAVLALQQAVEASAKRELAATCLLGVLCAALVGGGQGRAWARWAVAVAAATNAAAVLLLWQSGSSNGGGLRILAGALRKLVG